MSEHADTRAWTQDGQPGQPPRGTDPVRVHRNGRIFYWPSGVPGLGQRRSERTRTPEQAQARAAALRTEFDHFQRIDGRSGLPYFHAARNLVGHLESANAPKGTWRQYRSNWNCWMPEEIGVLPCGELRIMHWTHIFDTAVADGASVNTIRNLARTLGAVNTHGVLNGYFISEPFNADRERRRQVVRRATKQATAYYGKGTAHVMWDQCPMPENVDDYADAFETIYPGYGRRLVHLSFASGVRLAECLALRGPDRFEATHNLLTVAHQLDRYTPELVLRAPKDKEQRQALVWQHYAEVAISLATDCRATDGWWFPRDKDDSSWVERVSRMSRRARHAAGWQWSHHWLRHGYASWSISPRSVGGYDRSYADVAAWLGHSNPSVTTSLYLRPTPDAARAAKSATFDRPGIAPQNP